MNQTPICILCEGKKMRPHFYPPNIFNGITFRYYLCEDCETVSIFPLPEKDTFDLMYGPMDHSYLGKLEPQQMLKHSVSLKDYPLHTSHRFQLEFFNSHLSLIKGKKLLDYGCGGGFYVSHALAKGVDAIGVEYSDSFAALLREKTGLEIVSVSELEKKYANTKFDVIHFGHNLEHLTQPYKIFELLEKYTHPDTIYLVDGPLENNACLSRSIIEFFSKLKGRKSNTYAPYHLYFTTYTSQLAFFKKLHFEVIKYEAREQYWPLPQKPDYKSLRSILMFGLAHLSFFISGLSATQGNIFHFAGKRVLPKSVVS